MPQLQDPNFFKTVVLLCDFLPEGAFGIVLNRPTDMPATRMVHLEPAIGIGNDMPLLRRRPRRTRRGWILTADRPLEPGVPHDRRRAVSLDVAGAAAPRARDPPGAARARTRRIRRLGPRTAR